MTGEQVQAVTDMPCEIIYVRDYLDAATQLRNGTLDAFFGESPSTYYFRHLSYITYDDYFPLIYSPVAISTTNPDLEPIIRVIQAYLDCGGIYYFAQLYSEGSQGYLQSQLSESLSKMEKKYVQTLREQGRTVSVAFDSDNYPVSFYNEQEQQFQGIAIDVLEEISALTGIEFVRANEPGVPLATLLAKVDTGEAAMIAGISHSDGAPGRIQPAEVPFTSDRYALLSTADQADVEINQILYRTVGLLAGSTPAATYNAWFPDSTNTVTFTTTDDAFQALTLGISTC